MTERESATNKQAERERPPITNQDTMQQSALSGEKYNTRGGGEETDRQTECDTEERGRVA